MRPESLMGIKTFPHCCMVLFLKLIHALQSLWHLSPSFCHLLEIPNIIYILQLLYHLVSANDLVMSMFV